MPMLNIGTSLHFDLVPSGKSIKLNVLHFTQVLMGIWKDRDSDVKDNFPIAGTATRSPHRELKWRMSEQVL